MSKTPLPKSYDPREVEPRWLNFWLSHRFFHADATTPKAPYSITLPPPNVTGSLHMGHALGDTLQDVLVRWRRMQGLNTMWMPGTDHAGIATQMLVERHLQRSEGKTRHDLGREAFLERVWAWKERNGGRILEQLKVMGFSLDYERARFTMDPEASVAVREAFVRLYEEGLIYRAHRLVNWCKDCFTAVSDLEVNNVEEPGKLWELLYPVADSDEVITVATTRPETMLGDTGVAVHPDDERYRHLVGKRVRLPLAERDIPIVADPFVDPEFGSGAVKVTPAHDMNDFECGERCGLERLSIIDVHGKVVAPAPERYRGMTVEQAREAVVADLEAAGRLGEVKEHTVPRGRCDRSNTVIEPLLSEQWFVRARPLAEPALEAVERGKTQFVPELWTKTFEHWMKNIKDWCISRQLWWGHRIPAWYCDACSEITVTRDDPSSCGSCGSDRIRQDEDVLDTWFSSALWPFSTLGWPEKTPELRTFYPNSVLVTGPDIIFFWVSRMMMMGIHFLGKTPFRKVYFTPIVTDESGEKMSKVKGNVVDPLDVVHGATRGDLVARAEQGGAPKAAIENIKKHFPEGMNAAGADALRFSLAAMTTPGKNIKLSMERIEGYRHFINKLWNASRFAMMNLDGFESERFAGRLERGELDGLALADRWILSRLQQTAHEVDQALNGFRFSDAAGALYHFVWGELCDWYIELAKPSLAEDGPDEDVAERRFLTQGTLATVLEQTLRLLHPFTPFVTEEIWQKLPKPSSLPESLVITVYPRSEPSLVDGDAVDTMSFLQDVAVAIRSIRSTYRVPPSARIDAEVRVRDEGRRAILAEHSAIVENTARVSLRLGEGEEPVSQSAKAIVGADVEVIVPLADHVDLAVERERIEREIKKTDKEIAFISKKLDNPKFVERAPAEVVDKERERLDEENERKRRLAEALDALR